MHKKRRYFALAAILVAFVFIMSAAFTAHADTQNGRIILNYELEDNRFSIYRIGDLTCSGVALNETFAGYYVDLNNPNAAYTLTAFIDRDGIAPLKSEYTGSDGAVAFDGLSYGVYLIRGESRTVGNEYYSPSSAVISLSRGNNEAEINAKYSVTLAYQKFKLNCLKVWSDDEDFHDDISATLLCDGEVFERFTLTEDNSWKHSWDDLLTGHEWMIAEDIDSDCYSVSVARSGNTITMTNTRVNSVIITGATEPSTVPTETTHDSSQPTEDASSPSSDPSQPSTVPTQPSGVPSQPSTEPSQPNSEPSTVPSVIPQTGQLNWPVFALSVIGIILCAAGALISGKKRDEK